MSDPQTVWIILLGVLSGAVYVAARTANARLAPKRVTVARVRAAKR